MVRVVQRFGGLLLAVVPVVVSVPPAVGQVLVDHTCVDAARIPQAALDTARGFDVLFCHASVGGAIVSGLGTMAAADPGRYALDIAVDADASWMDTSDGLVHLDDGSAWMSPNKIAGFDDRVRNHGFGDRATVAFMKFCYIDWTPATDPEQIWADYRDMMEALEADYPAVSFVWWTSALNNNGDQWWQRALFDQRLREHGAASGKVVFDLAALESHDPDGNLALDDDGYEGLYAAFADDGQHPNRLGRERIAAAYWWLMARLAGWRVGPTAVELAADTPLLAGDGAATTRLVARLRDQPNDLDIETEERELSFALAGPGSLVGDNPVTTVRGRATIDYRSGSATGTAVVTATAPGLGDGQATIALIANHPPQRPTDLRCDGRADPTDVPHGWPELTWAHADPDAALGDRQSAYRLLVADDPALLSADIGNAWDTGKVATAAAHANPCPVALVAEQTYHWKVRTWDLSDAAGAWSQPATFRLAGPLGYSASLDPASGEIDFGADPALDLAVTGGFTIEFWLFRTDEGRDAVLLDKFVPFGGGWRIGFDASDHVYFRTRGERGGDRRVTAFDARIPTGEWHHIACVQTGDPQNDGIVYIDGVRRGSNGLINVPWPVSSELTLATSGAVIDELRISSMVRYDSDFVPPAARFEPDAATVALWHFDEGSGMTAADASSGGHTGTLAAGSGWGAGYLPAAPAASVTILRGETKTDLAPLAGAPLPWVEPEPVLGDPFPPRLFYQVEELPVILLTKQPPSLIVQGQ